MDSTLKVLFVNATDAFYRIRKYKVGDFFGPVDLGLHLAGRYKSLNIGVGLLSGSIFPGSNRLIFTGFSPCWGGFYISSMGGAGLVFDNLGINMLSIVGKAPVPSVLYLNRVHGEEIQVEIAPLDLNRIWYEGRGGIYSLMDHVFDQFRPRYENEPRILATGPASMVTDFGGVASVPVKRGALSNVDTWAGRGGFGSALLQEHGIAAVIYGGTHIDEDFRDRKVADEWFENRYAMKLAAKDLEITTKYRFDPNFDTGGTFGVNYATMGSKLLAFNYQSMNWSKELRLKLQREFILDHYLKQFNEETIKTRQQATCGEPCAAVCKKLRDEYKKDYEPYQTMGPLSGIFDQRAAEKLNHHADMLGFDAISVGGVISWLMECLDAGELQPADLGVSAKPVFNPQNFDIVKDSMHNALLGCEILDSIIAGTINLKEGARKYGRRLSRAKGVNLLNRFVYTAYARKGWMVPNQYWTPGALSPMAIMGKYYMYYGDEFVTPRELGKVNAQRMLAELIIDNMGICRFHRLWAEEMVPEIVESLYGLGEKFKESIRFTASRINGRNSSVFWESERNFEYIASFLRRKKEEGLDSKEFNKWQDAFEANPKEAALDFWYEIHKGVQESLREFN
ncbi:aldehyde ferredoxin oxidoreductase C-terminal domain-containing protein [Lentimicrobium sp.]|uniref:aldehyde ferredoxin oxidoreductase C-terminal domain-containing protein n=1 Tax=Lentimicrobium sp. TaxID=2034841 RepID=UPI002CE356AF|nr:aldehyde ferredoxin oxidoreductase C-terminal domain-containing protein [Lentimicrobium sp.]HPJ63863.1 aldehyde ferredoxin oxidoreductase N-terminal domain-containing protein [Lentimicrobium sp.]HPR27528.1 aldehyde ferredoxin oxidoreductase N-terminal domain-containing protein [Lentimicrobium sp.]